jgi:putative NADPH-quinone reductase
MRALVVLAHPLTDSYCHALADAAAEAMRAAGHHVDVIDLYAIDYRAAMSADERLAYHSEQPVLDPQVAEHIALLQGAETLVVVYPTWWSSMPAILKGWLERTMVPGVGFVFDDRGRVRPGLTTCRRIIGISTYGSKRSYVRAINDNGRRTMCRALRLSTGVRTRCTWMGLYGVDSSSDQQRNEFIDRVRITMGALR